MQCKVAPPRAIDDPRWRRQASGRRQTRAAVGVRERDYLTQRVVSHCCDERWRGGRLVETGLEDLVVRLWALKEFELTLQAAGFADITVCGDYRLGRPPRATDGWWCFQAVPA